MRELIVATRNKGKLREIKELLADLDFKIISLDEMPDMPEIVEDGKTFQDNAIKKALTIARHTNKLTLGEDSGLEVAALGNRPGVYSARFSGPQATDPKNNAKLIRLLKAVPMKKRQARYRCCAALADANGVVGVVSGSCSGLIATKAKGRNGFGYDPYFLIPRYNKTFGELPPEVKAKMSHRSHALKKVRKILEKY
jgi:XTP/dITP diphosphohydrolase